MLREIKFLMASFEPVVLLFASPQDLANIDFRLPVTFAFAIDEDSLEERVSINPPLYEPCLQRYFVVLLQAVRTEVWERLQNNHRIQAIYSRQPLAYKSQSSKPHRVINEQLQQFTLDLTADIVQFLTIEGEKQEKLERFNLTKIYYRQVRLLKEWAMSFAKVTFSIFSSLTHSWNLGPRKSYFGHSIKYEPKKSRQYCQTNTKIL